MQIRAIILWCVMILSGHHVARAQNMVHSASEVSGDATDMCPLERSAGLDELQRKSLARFTSPGSSIPPFDASRLASFKWMGFSEAPANVFLQDPRSKTVSEVVLTNLLGDGTLLEGPYVRVGSDRLDGPLGFSGANLDGAGGSQGSGGTEGSGGFQGADFRFLPDTTTGLRCGIDLTACSRFDAVNVYYHIDRFAREFWVDQMAFNPPFQATARVHAHGDGAFANGENKVLVFRMGDIFMKNAALSDDIIYHEYTHLVAASLGFNPTSDQTDQTRALSEAYADYFTATYTDDPRIGEWVVTCPDRAACVGPSNDAELRRLDLDPAVWNWKYGFPSDDLAYGFCLRYHTSDLKCKASNNNFTNPYVWGMIWASALWDLRNQLGPTVSNPLILAAIDKHTLDTDFITAARDLLEVDEDLFLGVNELVIRSVFRARGFILPLVNSVEEISSVAGKAVSVWPQPAQNEVHFSFISALPGAWSVSWYSLLGQRVRRTEFQPEIIGPQHITESVQDLTPGVYVVELTNGKRVETIQVVVVQ